MSDNPNIRLVSFFGMIADRLSRESARPKEAGIKQVRQLYAKGETIVIWVGPNEIDVMYPKHGITCQVARWLRAWDVPYHTIEATKPQYDYIHLTPITQSFKA